MFERDSSNKNIASLMSRLMKRRKIGGGTFSMLISASSANSLKTVFRTSRMVEWKHVLEAYLVLLHFPEERHDHVHGPSVVELLLELDALASHLDADKDF